MKWTFPKADSGQIKGFNDEGIERFKGSPMKSLAREICQNSLDARIDDTKPVKLEFSEFCAVFPGVEDYQVQIEKMLSYWKPTQLHDKGVITFLEKAKKYLQDNTHISFLRISDFNTTGLTGVLSDGSPWDNLLKRVGASDKLATDGGSRGIGKAAPFTCSCLRTVFYATCNTDSENRDAFQGVARLVGYKTGNDEEVMTGTSFYGEDHCKASLSYLSLDKGFRRENTQTGTDIFVAGFNKSVVGQNWEDEIIKHAVDSFFYAIHKNKIVLKAGSRELSSSTLQQIVEDVVAQSQSFPGHAEQYYKVLTSNSEKAQDFEREVTTQGRRGVLKLRLLVDDSMSVRRIAMVRNTGMKIFDKNRISGSLNFAGVLVAEGDELNRYLKSMEDATHENWSENNTDNPGEAKAFLKEIWKFCRESLDSLIRVRDDETIDSGLGDVLPLNTGVEEESERSQIETIDPTYKKITTTPTKKRKKRRGIQEDNLDEDAEGVPESEGEEESSGNPSGNSTNNKGGDGGESPGLSEGMSPTKMRQQKVPITFNKFKTLCCDNTRGHYRIVFVPSKTMNNCSLVLNMVTSTNENVPPEIKEARDMYTGEKLEVQGNEIKSLVFCKNEKRTVLIEIDYTDYCSIEGEAYGFTK